MDAGVFVEKGIKCLTAIIPRACRLNRSRPFTLVSPCTKVRPGFRIRRDVFDRERPVMNERDRHHYD